MDSTPNGFVAINQWTVLQLYTCKKCGGLYTTPIRTFDNTKFQGHFSSDYCPFCYLRLTDADKAAK